MLTQGRSVEPDPLTARSLAALSAALSQRCAGYEQPLILPLRTEVTVDGVALRLVLQYVRLAPRRLMHDGTVWARWRVSQTSDTVETANAIGEMDSQWPRSRSERLLRGPMGRD
jgi:hypothetical protein